MRKILFICLLLLSVLMASAQPSSFEARRGVIPGGYDFWVHTPDDYGTGAHPFPLIIFLHGASLCGNNLDRVLRYGTMDAIEKGKHIPCLNIEIDPLQDLVSFGFGGKSADFEFFHATLL